ncbi:hypothetical protein [Methylobacterium oxalidis]|uniref:O-methyltransferase n=1 Tax=Methylobacterium oxalidis TaxID=944322 RepID=A0A512J5I2_9HYPH|nr:hypothetical protein [Methylobacterium oxalidis]GEP05247.1 hypothetical protein MOX02_32850 [Methylobacterium oxalidis]GJE29947.1 hypothetical protein LDDCCGHA_0110 [Methylobacterium oxalidis]GLS64709.1 hypothetical protein GCM10007888_30900 [Methylobacterium oxalidis]
MHPRPPILMERLRRRVLGPLFDRLGYDLVPASPDWVHRPLSTREVERLLSGAAERLAADLAAAGIPAGAVRADVDRFWALIPEAPVRQRRGGSGFNGALQLYVAMRALAPRHVIESGVFRGLTTWVIRQACPDAAILCFDPDLSGLQYRDAAARYASGDWSAADLRDIDPAATVAFFDDHVSQGRRVIEARERGITRLLFDDDAAAHRIHAHGGPAHPTIAMVTDAAEGREPIRWLRNGRAFEQPADDPLVREAAACIARAHAFDDLHRATGYAPARLTAVTLHEAGAPPALPHAGKAR